LKKEREREREAREGRWEEVNFGLWRQKMFYAAHEGCKTVLTQKKGKLLGTPEVH
jgi:hypothetical protein